MAALVGDKNLKSVMKNKRVFKYPIIQGDELKR